MRDGVVSVLSSNHVLFWGKWMKRVVKEEKGEINVEWESCILLRDTVREQE